MFGFRHRPTITDPKKVILAYFAGAIAFAGFTFLTTYGVGILWTLNSNNYRNRRSGSSWDDLERVVGRPVAFEEFQDWLLQVSIVLALIVFFVVMIGNFFAFKDDTK